MLHVLANCRDVKSGVLDTRADYGHRFYGAVRCKFRLCVTKMSVAIGLMRFGALKMLDVVGVLSVFCMCASWRWRLLGDC